MEKSSLSPKQILAASKIAMGESHKRAAEIAKVTPQTISEWKQKPEFIALLNEMKLTIVNESQDRLRSLTSYALDTVSKIMEDSKNEKLRLDAAKYVLDTILIAPSKEMGLWSIGPTTPEEVLEEKLMKENPLHGLLKNQLF